MTEPRKPPPKWVPAACMGIGIAAGGLVMRNGLGIESRVLQIVVGAVVAGAVAFAALGAVHLFTRRNAS